MSGRDAILGKIRRALAAPSDSRARQAAVAERLAAPPRNLVPARGQLEPAARADLFREMAERVQATVTRLASSEEIPAAVTDYLRRHNLHSEIRMGDDPRLRKLPWQDVPQLEVRDGPSDGRDMVAVSHAFAGVAETGTLVMVSGPDNPTTLNLLPDTHIVVLAADDIAGDYETVFDRLRAVYGKDRMPRTANMITGPSRSADIEQTLILGAHGPRALHIVVVG